MFLPSIPRWLTSGSASLVLLLLVACGDSSGPGADGTSATLSGTVRTAAGAALENAQITIGPRQATSDANGQFEVTGLTAGAVTVQIQRAGYLAVSTPVTLGAGANSHDFALSVQEVFLSGPHAMYLAAGSGPIRGVIIILGGPVTSGFVTGGQIVPGDPVLEQSLQDLGHDLRALAASSRVAVVGTSTSAMANDAGSDNTLLAAMSDFAALSGHPEVAGAPILMVGFSGGAPEASGLVSRNPDRSIGLAERVPVSVTTLTESAQLAVPTFVMQAALDAVVSNPDIKAIFSANRAQGGLWALTVEPGVAHNMASVKGNAAMTGWISTVLALRLGATAGDPLVALDQQSGWLGNQSTLEIAPWASYSGDRTTASWLLSESVATSWQGLQTE